MDGESQWALALGSLVEGAEAQVVFLAATLFEMISCPSLQGFFFSLFIYLAVLCSIRDLSSLSRGRTRAPCVGNTES